LVCVWQFHNGNELNQQRRQPAQKIKMDQTMFQKSEICKAENCPVKQPSEAARWNMLRIPRASACEIRNSISQAKADFTGRGG
jgi:hypothetical protein